MLLRPVADGWPSEIVGLMVEGITLTPPFESNEHLYATSTASVFMIVG